MPTIPQNHEEKFQKIMVQLREMDSPFTEKHLEYIAIVERDGEKNLVFLPGCILHHEVKMVLMDMWDQCKI